VEKLRAIDFEEVLLTSVESALSSVFGPATMKAVDFYIDKRIALTNPTEYSRSMQKLFGEGAKVLIGKMIEGIAKGAGLEGGYASLEECVAKARAKLGPRSD